MHFAFRPCGDIGGGIRLIDDIPNFPICHIEGKNGVGKSLALRLLELISGEQPYSTNPRAWNSLRNNLGEIDITISDLGGKTLRVRLQPDNWSLEPEAIGEWLGSASLDDEPINITAVRSLLSVVRIAGDESFEGTIVRRLETESQVVARAHSWFNHQLSLLEEILEPLMTEAGLVDIEARTQARLDEVNETLSKAEASLSDQQQNLSFLSKAMSAHSQLNRLDAELPAIEKELQQVEGESSRLKERLRSSKDRQTTLLDSFAGESELEEQLGKVRRQRDARAKRLGTLTKDCEAAAAQAKAAPEPDAVAAAISLAQEELQQVAQDLMSAGHSITIRNLSTSLRQTLDDHQDLDQEIIALLSGETQSSSSLTVHELRIGIRRREVELTSVDDPRLRALKLANEALSEHLKDLESLAERIQKRERARDALAKSQEDLKALVRRFEGTSEARAEYDTVTDRIDKMEAELRGCVAREARLRIQADQLRGDRSKGELRELVDTVVKKFSLPSPEALEDLYATTRATLEQAGFHVAQLREKQQELHASLARQQAEIGHVAARLASTEWLPKDIRQALLKEQQRSQALQGLRNALKSVQESFYVVRDYFDQLLAATQFLSREVVRRDWLSGDVAFLEALTDELGERLRSEFDRPEIRSALFDGGQLETIDLRELEARWRTTSGEYRSRPFEAFSSGEQAFAYTRARIERIALIPAKHRVIALDEFGAFVARDRLERLASTPGQKFWDVFAAESGQAASLRG